MNNRESYAVTPVIGGVIALFIIAITVGSVIFVGLSYVQELESKEGFQNLGVLCNAVVDNIDDLTTSKPGKGKVIPFTVDKGSISIDKNAYDRTIVMYANESDDKYNFTVTGLDNYDHRFNLLMGPGGNSGNISAHVHWIDGDLAGYREDVGVQNDGSVVMSSSDYGLTGTVEIFLNDTTVAPDFLIGKIWLFDSNYLECKLSFNELPYTLSIEKGGIVYSNSEQRQVERPFDLNAEDNHLQMKIVQFKASKSFSISGNNIHSKIYTNSIGNNVREIARLYYIKIQFHNHNAQTWRTHFNDNYDEFVLLPDGDTLFYAPSDPFTYPDGVWTTFSHSLVEISTN